MNVYTSEEEQIDAVRRFFTENGKVLIFSLLLGLGGIWAWKYWQSHQNNVSMQSADGYTHIINELSLHDSSQVEASAQQFMLKNPNNYGVFVALQLAQNFVSKGNYSQAEQQLMWAVDTAKESNLHALVTLRLARVLLQEKKYDAALNAVKEVKGIGWLAASNNIRGDILSAKGDIQGARAAYSQGITSDDNSALQGILQMKLSNLSS